MRTDIQGQAAPKETASGRPASGETDLTVNFLKELYGSELRQ